eukprot:TRINITY_DN17450_c0_g1_i3.p3 TRINITY_DN17450_c0_g1~~TRINITY_DN17450_c0_g1_i3.p3  ORF type:complete len:115 (+),score=17.80 TRINITY_DN17450_c0_g1_i3:169-513(+)
MCIRDRYSPYTVFQDAEGYEKLFIVGDNWLEKDSQKPIALMVGFNNWKYGFTADYLKEYRVVFTPRKLTNLSAFKLFFGINPKPNILIVWGYTCLLYTSPSPRDLSTSRMPSSA